MIKGFRFGVSGSGRFYNGHNNFEGVQGFEGVSKIQTMCSPFFLVLHRGVQEG